MNGAFRQTIRRRMPGNVTATHDGGFGGSGFGRSKLGPFKPAPGYSNYKSPYGPKMKPTPNLGGIGLGKIYNYGTIAAGFGVSAGIFALFFFGEVPKIRNDILSKVPVIGDYFIREVPPEDNPF